MRASASAQAIISWISYIRVSTVGQGRSGLGLDAQKEAVARHIATAGGHLVAEFQEVESGKRSDRPVLTAALAACRARRAVLIVAKLDRLARNTKFQLTIAEGAGDGGVVFADLPQIPLGAMGKFFITLMAAVAELEAGLISQRTCAALAIAKARGVKLGNPRLRTGECGGGDAGRGDGSSSADQSRQGPLCAAQADTGTGVRHHQIGDGFPAILAAWPGESSGGMETCHHGLEHKETIRSCRRGLRKTTPCLRKLAHRWPVSLPKNRPNHARLAAGPHLPPTNAG
jgi:DNA invertase Pin-like site-specific DNA recombinase